MSNEGFYELTYMGIPIVFNTDPPKHEGTVTFFNANDSRALALIKRIAAAEGIRIVDD